VHVQKKVAQNAAQGSMFETRHGCCLVLSPVVDSLELAWPMNCGFKQDRCTANYMWEASYLCLS